MASLKERLAKIRERRPFLDHVLRTQEHYGEVKANQQAGGVTYFAFLSFFPILALAVLVVGLLSRVYPEADQDLRRAVNDVLPGIIGGDAGQVSLDDIRTFSGWAAVIGVLGVLYSGLAWVSSLRDALDVVFEKPVFRRPSFVVGKLRDLVTLMVIGVVLFVSVAVTGFARGFSDDVLGWVGLDSELGWLVDLAMLALGLAANALLFFLMFRLLADPALPGRSLVSGAVLGAVAFELLKVLSQYLLGATKGQPAFQAFGIALILLVWINYFSRVILYAASWAHTTAAARALRGADGPAQVQGPKVPSLEPLVGDDQPPGQTWLAPAAGGAAAMLALVAVVRRRL